MTPKGTIHIETDQWFIRICRQRGRVYSTKRYRSNKCSRSSWGRLSKYLNKNSAQIALYGGWQTSYRITGG